jgi:predicted small lipoprotein YifL
MNAHNIAVLEMFKQIKPIVEDYETSVAINTLLVTLAACGQQLDMPNETFKAMVVFELDRLMLVDAKTEGLSS